MKTCKYFASIIGSIFVLILISPFTTANANNSEITPDNIELTPEVSQNISTILAPSSRSKIIEFSIVLRNGNEIKLEFMSEGGLSGLNSQSPQVAYGGEYINEGLFPQNPSQSILVYVYGSGYLRINNCINGSGRYKYDYELSKDINNPTVVSIYSLHRP